MQIKLGNREIVYTNTFVTYEDNFEFTADGFIIKVKFTTDQNVNGFPLNLKDKNSNSATFEAVNWFNDRGVTSTGYSELYIINNIQHYWTLRTHKVSPNAMLVTITITK